MGNDQSTNANLYLAVTNAAFVRSRTTLQEFLDQIRAANDVEVARCADALTQLRGVQSQLTDFAAEAMKEIIEQIDEKYEQLKTRVTELEDLINSNRVTVAKKFSQLIKIADGLKLLDGTPYSGKRYIGTVQTGDGYEHIFVSENLTRTSGGFPYVLVVSDDELARLSAQAPENASRTHTADGQVLTVAIAKDTQYTPLTIALVDDSEQTFTLSVQVGCNCGSCRPAGRLQLGPVKTNTDEPKDGENHQDSDEQV